MNSLLSKGNKIALFTFVLIALVFLIGTVSATPVCTSPNLSINITPSDYFNYGPTAFISVQCPDGLSCLFSKNGAEVGSGGGGFVSNENRVGVYNYTFTSDAAGIYCAGSVSRTLTIYNDTTNPTAYRTSPASGSYIRGTISISADASDDLSGIERVEFYRNGPTYLGTDYSAPYSFDWDTTSVSDGSYSLYVKAYDNSGLNSGYRGDISGNAGVTVDNNAPTTNVNGNGYLEGTWTNSSVTLTASCSDSASGCNSTYYCTDDGISVCDPLSGTLYSLGIEINSPGITYVRFKSMDDAGNLESPAVSFQVKKIGTYEPSCSEMDLERNWKISVSDLQYVKNHLNETGCNLDNGYCSGADVNRDSEVNEYDLDVVQSHLLEKCDNTAPLLSVPGDMIVEATGASGAIVTFTFNVSDNESGVSEYFCYYNSGDTFPLGTTNVTCGAVDNVENTAYSSFLITVQDTTSPTVNVPSDITVEATDSSGAVVSFEANATDDVDGSLPVNCPHNSGDAFALGITNVVCSATDSSGNQGNNSFSINVQDTTAPIIKEKENLTIEATDTNGTIVNYGLSPLTSDIVDGSGRAVCSPENGTLFSIGITTVTCTANDSSGNNAAPVTFTVSVVDTTAPVITMLGSNVTLEVNSVYNDDGATAYDIVEGDLTSSMVVNNYVNADLVGVYTVTYDVQDSNGNTALQIKRTVNVVDTTAPIITIEEYNTNPTNQDIVVTASTNEGTLNQDSYTFTENGEFTFIATDDSGNSASETVTITNIDKVAPTATVEYTTTSWTNGNVSATITPSENVTITNNDGLSYNFTENGEFTFEFIDNAGNNGTLTVTVSNIDKVAPVTTAEGTTGGRCLSSTTSECNGYEFNTWTNEEVQVTLTCTDSLSNCVSLNYLVNGESTNTYEPASIGVLPKYLTFSQPGYYNITFYSIDNAGNVENTNSVMVKITATSLIGGYFEFNEGETAENATNVTLHNDLTISIPTGNGTSSVFLPAGTTISMVNGSLNLSLLTAGNVSLSNLSNLGERVVAHGSLQWGIPDFGLMFSNPITIRLFLGTEYEGQTLNILRSTTGNNGWTSDGISPTSCFVTLGFCEFNATKASYFASTKTTPAPTIVETTSGGGGNSYAPKKKTNQTIVNESRALEENNIAEEIIDVQSNSNASVGGITGAVIGAIGNTSGSIAIAFLVILIAAIIIVKLKKRNMFKKESI